MSQSLVFLLSFAVFVCFCSCGVYVFQGDPYHGGFEEKDIGVIRLWQDEGIKYHSVVYLPKIPGTYSVLYYIGGLGGIIPAEFYSVTLKRIAAHGFIVIGVDHIAGGVFPPSAEEVLNWCQANLHTYVNKHAPGVSIAWDHIGLGGHSGGAQSVLEMVLKNPKVANCTMFLEGGWISKLPVEMKKQFELGKVNFSHPALVFATEYATKRSLILPQCGSFGQAETLYGDWNCPRVLMNVTGFGHCDFLDPIGWEGCHLTDFCYTTAANNRTLYRTWAQGVFSAYLVYYVQGNKAMLPYFTDQSKFLGVGMEDFHVDVQCSGVKAEEPKEPMQQPEKIPILSYPFTPKLPFWQTVKNPKVSMN